VSLPELVEDVQVPRRRSWARIAPARTYLAGQAGRLVHFKRMMDDVARSDGGELGGPKGQEEHA
jgi:hypothetical protein